GKTAYELETWLEFGRVLFRSWALKDFILEQETDLARLGWVDRSPQKGEPEPLRWLGATAFYRVYEIADTQESKSPSDATSLLAKERKSVGQGTGAAPGGARPD